MSFQSLLENRMTAAQAAALPGPGEQPAAKVIPIKGWEPGVQWNGQQGTLITEARETAPTTEVWDDLIRRAGLSPDEVEVYGDVKFRGWDTPVKGGGTTQLKHFSCTFRLKVRRTDITELMRVARAARKVPKPTKAKGPDDYGHAYTWAPGDLQLGKADGDGPDGTLNDFFDLLESGVEELKRLQRHMWIDHVSLPWLGDCIEGFVSQNGANAWRTTLTLTEQTTMLRRIMLEATKAFAPLVDRVTESSIPGNHDMSVRLGGKGVTRYDDSHALNEMAAVGDALAMNPKAFGHVQILTPAPDEVTVTTRINGTNFGFMHGHFVPKGKHWEWLGGHSIGGQPVAAADIILSGHWHSASISTKSHKTWLTVPAMESESTWWRHLKGDIGDPGIMSFTSRDGEWANLRIHRTPARRARIAA